MPRAATLNSLRVVAEGCSSPAEAHHEHSPSNALHCCSPARLMKYGLSLSSHVARDSCLGT